MADEGINHLLEILQRADAEGAVARDKKTVAWLDQHLGRPLAVSLAPARLALLGNHGHADRPEKNAQFIFQEAFALPSPAWPRIANFLDHVQGGAVTRSRGVTHAYLGLTLSHAWRLNERHGQPAHLRFGFAFEAKKERCEQARPVLGGPLLRERLAGTAARAVVLEEPRPVPGINSPGKAPGLFSIQLGSMLVAEDVRGFASVEALLERAAAELQALHAALAAEPIR
jgi:hypothetical protein